MSARDSRREALGEVAAQLRDADDMDTERAAVLVDALARALGLPGTPRQPAPLPDMGAFRPEVMEWALLSAIQTHAAVLGGTLSEACMDLADEAKFRATKREWAGVWKEETFAAAWFQAKAEGYREQEGRIRSEEATQ